MKNTAIAATAWNDSEVQLRIFSQDTFGQLRGYKWSGSWEKTGLSSSVPVGTHMVAVSWQNGQIVKVFYQSEDGTIWEESDDGSKKQVA